MNVYAAPASQRAATRQADAQNATPPATPHEIKYRQDAAGYVASMLTELRQIAGKAGFDKLVKSLDAAYYDAYAAVDAKSRDAAPAPRPLGETAGEKTSKSMEPNAT